jgi:CubicO group peptidase (beta-lactamase class C family)
MSLVERGILDLDQPIASYVPEFETWTRGLWRDHVALRHVLAHCSGLPGYSRNNVELRKRHAPLADFVVPYGSEPLVFEPGTLHYYSNCGILMAAEVVARAVSATLGRALPAPAIAAYHAYVASAILRPLGLDSTTFFPDEVWSPRVARVHGVANQGPDWEMSNSDYYRSLGIPWGGLYSTPSDLVRFVDSFLPRAAGRARMASGARVLSSGTAGTMIHVQFAPPDAPASLAPDLRDSPPLDQPRSSVEWGVGWMLKGAQRRHHFGSLSSPGAFGHLGASGTMVWADPSVDVAVVLLTNRALATGWANSPPRIALFSNAVMGALA